MLERGKLERGVLEMVDTESLMPQDHLLRKIDAAVDWERLYEMVEPLYSKDNGRPSVDPVVPDSYFTAQTKKPSFRWTFSTS